MLVTCQNCQNPIDAPEKFYGRIVKCPYCAVSVEIPSADESPFPSPETSAMSSGVIPPPLIQPISQPLEGNGRSRASNNRQVVVILASICACLLIAVLYLIFSKTSRVSLASSDGMREMAELKNELQSLKKQQAIRESESTKRENELKARIEELRKQNRESNASRTLQGTLTKQQRGDSRPKPVTGRSDNSKPDEEVAIGPKGPVLLPQDVPFAENARALVDERLELLARHPAPSVRVQAVMQLGRASEFVDIVVPALLKAHSSDASDEVRSAVILTLGELSELGAQKEAASAFLNNIVKTEKLKPDKMAAAESLIAIDPNSDFVKRIIKTTLQGGSNSPPRPSNDSRSSFSVNAEVRENRIWACEQLQNDDMEGKWAIGLLIEILEVEAKEVIAGRTGYTNQTGPRSSGYESMEPIDHCLAALMFVGRDDARVRAHLARYANIELSHSENATQLRVVYDSLLKELD